MNLLLDVYWDRIVGRGKVNQWVGCLRGEDFTCLNPFTTGNPFWGQIYLEVNIGRDSGALKGLTISCDVLHCLTVCDYKFYMFFITLDLTSVAANFLKQ